MAGCCLLVALLAMAAAAARQRAAYRTDVAALRVVGAPTRQIRSAGLGELCCSGGIAVVAGTGAGLLASRLLLDALPLAQVPAFSVPLEAASPILPAVVTGLLLALIVAVVAGRGRRPRPRRHAALDPAGRAGRRPGTSGGGAMTGTMVGAVLRGIRSRSLRPSGRCC